MALVRPKLAFTLIAILLYGALGDDDDDEARKKWPLIYAAGEGDSTKVAELIASGTDVMQRSKDGETALHVSTVRGDLETVRLLLKAGADVNARTPRGSTLFMTPLQWTICARTD